MQAQTRNDQMQGLLTADLLPATDRNLAAQFYNNTEPEIAASAVTVPLDLTRVNTAPTLYSLADDAVTIAASGIYLIAAHMAIVHSSGTDPATVVGWLEVDAGAGFAEATATKFYAVVLGSGGGGGAAVTILRLLAGDVVRIRAVRDSGGDTLKFLVSGGCRLSLACLYLTP